MVKESPRYLLSRDRVGEAVDVINTIGKRNGVAADKLALTAQIVNRARQGQNEDIQRVYSSLDLFKQGRKMSLMTLNLMFIWVVNSITYRGS